MLLFLALPLSILLCLCTAYAPLSDDTLKSLPDPGEDFDIHNGKLLAPILRTRVSGTPGNAAVRQHFIDFFKKDLPSWKVELHNSSSTTPTSNGKKIPFVNFIAYRDPPGTQPGDVSRLTLVAHYDSKLTPKGFIGATDSAAPCAMLMYAARSIDKALTKKWEKMSKEGMDELDEKIGIQILFLDGEEAFQYWTDSDSLYGSRALASTWEHELHPLMSTFRNPLDSISLFVLLDLLGSAGTQVPSFFKTTHWAYKHMAKAEDRLRNLRLFKSSPNYPPKAAKRENKKPRREPAFLPDSEKGEETFYGGGIQDDHLPFMARGVEVLHLIAYPFPKVWHRIEDDGEHLDIPTVQDWAKLITAFAAEWMELEGFMDVKKVQQRGVEDVMESRKTEL